IADFLLMNITPLQEKKATLFAQIYDILINTAPLINQVTPLKFKLYQKIGNGKIKEFTDVTVKTKVLNSKNMNKRLMILNEIWSTVLSCLQPKPHVSSQNNLLISSSS